MDFYENCDVSYNGERLMSTQCLAKFLDVPLHIIQTNKRNSELVEGVHYLKVPQKDLIKIDTSMPSNLYSVVNTYVWKPESVDVWSMLLSDSVNTKKSRKRRKQKDNENFAPEEDEIVRNAIALGITIQAIGNFLGRSEDDIRIQCERLNIALPKRMKWNAGLNTTITELQARGISTLKIAELLKCSEDAVRAQLFRLKKF